MKDRFFVQGFFSGFLVGALFVLFLLQITPNIFTQVTELIENCEKSLARNQHCIIIAVKDETISDDKKIESNKN
jgi:hypothetical protein